MSNCANALACRHAACEPTEHYRGARVDTDVQGTLRAFWGWPARHVAAIVRARLEHPGRARELGRLESVQLGMRRSDRGR